MTAVTVRGTSRGVDPPRFAVKLAARLWATGIPDEVLLFGSYAKGLAQRTSDVDLLVLCRGPVAPAAEHELRDALGTPAIKVDLHVVSWSDALAARTDPAGFLGSVLSGAVSLFHRPQGCSILAGRSELAQAEPGPAGAWEPAQHSASPGRSTLATHPCGKVAFPHREDLSALY